MSINETQLKVGDTVLDNSVGSGIITSISSDGYHPTVNNLVVGWLYTEGGVLFNPNQYPDIEEMYSFC